MADTKTLVTPKATYKVRAGAKARPVRFIDNGKRVAIGGTVTIEKPLRGKFTWKEVTSQADLKKYYEEWGLTHLIDKVEQ